MHIIVWFMLVYGIGRMTVRLVPAITTELLGGYVRAWGGGPRSATDTAGRVFQYI